jgi:predicted nuclease of predicted toxin-antitoxin system
VSTPLRLLVDVGVGTAVESWLRAAGHDAAAVRDRDPRLPDADILAWAVAEQRIVVTMDKDFGELVYRSGQAHAGVLLLRLDDADSAAKVRAVEAIIAAYADKLSGHFSVYQDGHFASGNPRPTRGQSSVDLLWDWRSFRLRPTREAATDRLNRPKGVVEVIL